VDEKKKNLALLEADERCRLGQHTATVAKMGSAVTLKAGPE